MNTPTDSTYIANYYAKRAREYDKVYEKPERQSDIAELRSMLCDLLKERWVLEVACGTGPAVLPITDNLFQAVAGHAGLTVCKGGQVAIEDAGGLKDVGRTGQVDLVVG